MTYYYCHSTIRRPPEYKHKKLPRAKGGAVQPPAPTPSPPSHHDRQSSSYYSTVEDEHWNKKKEKTSRSMHARTRRKSRCELVFCFQNCLSFACGGNMRPAQLQGYCHSSRSVIASTTTTATTTPDSHPFPSITYLYFTEPSSSLDFHPKKEIRRSFPVQHTGDNPFIVHDT